MKLRRKARIECDGGLFNALVGFLVGYWVIGPIFCGLIVLLFWLWLIS